jgi:hypothetical protein
MGRYHNYFFIAAQESVPSRITGPAPVLHHPEAVGPVGVAAAPAAEAGAVAGAAALPLHDW